MQRTEWRQPEEPPVGKWGMLGGREGRRGLEREKEREVERKGNGRRKEERESTSDFEPFSAAYSFITRNRVQASVSPPPDHPHSIPRTHTAEGEN